MGPETCISGRYAIRKLSVYKFNCAASFVAFCSLEYGRDCNKSQARSILLGGTKRTCNEPVWGDIGL